MAPETRHSVCALDCPDTCSLLIDVDTNGVGSRLRGDPSHPITRGFLCGKVARYLDREYSTERLLHPLQRVAAKGEGRFERISWEQAISTITTRLKSVAEEWGSQAILPYSYAGTMGMLNGSGMDRRFFHRMGASRLDRTICSAAGAAGLNESVGARYGMEPEQFRHSKLILAWGANVLGTNVHLWPFIVEARRNGAKFYVIDPIVNRTGKLADKIFPIHPGSDLALALGMMHVIVKEQLYDRSFLETGADGFEIFSERIASYTPDRVSGLTGIPAEDLIALAREYATSRPAGIRLNYGVQRSERGGAAVQAIALLPVLTGGYREVGGGLQLSTSQAFQFDRAAVERADLQPGPTRLVNMSQLGHVLNELADPPIKATVIYNSNPAAIAPDQSSVIKGLKRPDLFTVVLDQFQTDSADFADIVLPSTTFLEHTDLYLAYGHYYLQLARPALPAPGEAKSNVEVFRLLAKAMGFTDPCFDDTEDDMIRQALASGHPFLEGITLERLEAERSVRLSIPEPFLPFASGAFPTPSGRVNLAAPNLDYVPPEESRLGNKSLLKKYPLECVSSKNDDSMNSTFGNRRDVDLQTAITYLHTEDAAPRGIASGDRVRVYNDRGSYFAVAAVNGAVRSGVVRIPAVRWNKLSQSGMGVNTLTSPRLTDMGGGPTFYSCLVEVEKCGD
ncbi:MAG TPA: molybdopterin-dependent oxidoreductase [Bryobacteraceae bacterium]|nr:molybdopterin-dependent oxidoreductase [Bryobacteraceae bacterium]